MSESKLQARLIILPVWLKKTLEANHLGLSSSLDAVSLTRILSVNDVSFYVALNEYLFDKIHPGIHKTFMPFDFLGEGNTVLHDSKGGILRKEDVDAMRAKLRKKVNEYYMADFQDPKDINPRHLIDLLAYNEISEIQGEKDSIDDYVFDIVLLKDNVYGIIFKHRDKDLPIGPQQIESYDKALDLLIGIHGFEQMAATAAFNEYVALSKRNAIW